MLYYNMLDFEIQEAGRDAYNDSLRMSMLYFAKTCDLTRFCTILHDVASYRGTPCGIASTLRHLMLC